MPNVHERYADGTSRVIPRNYVPGEQLRKMLSDLKTTQATLLDFALETRDVPGAQPLREQALAISAVVSWALRAPPDDIAKFTRERRVKDLCAADWGRRLELPAAKTLLAEVAEQVVIQRRGELSRRVAKRMHLFAEHQKRAGRAEPLKERQKWQPRLGYASRRDVLARVLAALVNDLEFESIVNKYDRSGRHKHKSWDELVDAAMRHAERGAVVVAATTFKKFDEAFFDPERLAKAAVGALGDADVDGMYSYAAKREERQK